LLKASTALSEIRIQLDRIDQEIFDPANAGKDMSGLIRLGNALNTTYTAGTEKYKGLVASRDALGNMVGGNAREQSLQEQYAKFATEFKTSMSDSISTAIFEGGAAGGKKLRSYLEQVFIQRPFKIILEGAVDSIMGVNSSSGNWFSSLFKMATGAPVGGGGSGIPSMTDFADRASGGTVNPRSMYRVNEQGIEMLSVGGKDYLMNGAQSGRITPAGQVGTTVTYAPQINIDSRADQAQVYALVNQAVKQGNAKLVDDLRQARVI
jgi:hypothetical protein